MKVAKLIFLLSFLTLLVGCISLQEKDLQEIDQQAKSQTDNQFQVLVDGKTQEQIVAEYQRWSRAKKDWPFLSLFREANADLASPEPEEYRVVLMGDSITQGWSDASPEFFQGKPYIDRGISGQTTPQMLIRFQADVVTLQPKAVVILAGTNDLAENTGPATNEMIQNNFKSMAEIAQANGIHVVLSSIIPVERYPWRPQLKPTQRIIEINHWLRQYCQDNGHVYLDYFSALANDHNGMAEQYTYDGVHANKAGYEVMQVLVEEAIQRSFK